MSLIFSLTAGAALTGAVAHGQQRRGRNIDQNRWILTTHCGQIDEQQITSDSRRSGNSSRSSRVIVLLHLEISTPHHRATCNHRENIPIPPAPGVEDKPSTRLILNRTSCPWAIRYREIMAGFPEGNGTRHDNESLEENWLESYATDRKTCRRCRVCGSCSRSQRMRRDDGPIRRRRSCCTSQRRSREHVCQSGSRRWCCEHGREFCQSASI